MKYTVVIERIPNNYAAYVPDLPGCVVSVGTRKEVLKEIREAIASTSKACAKTANPYRNLRLRRPWWMPFLRQRGE